MALRDAPDLRIILSNCAPDQATDIARSLVSARVVACVNIIPQVTSVYRWDGAVCAEKEATLVIKTTQAQVEAASAHLRDVHPYDVPEIAVLTPDQVLDIYDDWAKDVVASPEDEPAR